jgi:hypothetical protein
MSKRNEPGKPTQQMNPDADLVQMFAVGCGMVFVLFLCGWVAIALLWMG